MILAKKPGSNPRVVLCSTHHQIWWGAMTYKPTRLSTEAFEELRAIVEHEIKKPISNEETEVMGIDLLKLFALLLTPETRPSGNQPTEQERKALSFLQDEMRQGRSPSIRDLCKAMGFSSSRSGFRLLNMLMAKGWLYRNSKGDLCLTDHNVEV